MEVVSASQVARAPPQVRLRDVKGQFVTLPVSGYHGLCTYLPVSAAPARAQALRPPEWIRQADCSTQQWEAFALQR
eukprot:566852-Rhodomonas_salina.1